MDRRRSAALAALTSVGAVLLAVTATQPTTAAWTDDAVFAAQASGSEFFGCQQSPVVVTTLEGPPAGSITVQGIDAACDGENMTVEVFDTTLGGTPSEIVVTSSFESDADEWEPYGGGELERVSTASYGGLWSLRSYDRTDAAQAPGRDLTGLVTPGGTYWAGLWVFHEGPGAETFRLVLRETRDDGDVETTIAEVTVEPGVWTEIEGELVVDGASTAQVLVVEAVDEPLLEFYLDDARVTVPATPGAGGWVTGTGPVVVPDVTFASDAPFTPVPGTGTMEVRVEIDGVSVPATWVYELPAVVAGCRVVDYTTREPVPGIECGETIIQAVDFWAGANGRIANVDLRFDAPGTSTAKLTHLIEFTVEWTTIPGLPADWDFSSAAVRSNNLLVYPDSVCSPESFRSMAYGWASGPNANAHFQLYESGLDATSGGRVC